MRGMLRLDPFACNDDVDTHVEAREKGAVVANSRQKELSRDITDVTQ